MGVTGVKRRSVLVVDDSAAVRETIRTALEGEYEVHWVTGPDYVADAAGWNARVNVLILGVDPELLGRPPELPTLWLAEHPRASVRPGSRVLSRQFSARELRRCVASLLDEPAEPTTRLARRLGEPYVPAGAACVLRSAVENRLPVLVYGEPGTGKHALARAVHHVSGGDCFFFCRGRTFASDPRMAAGASGHTQLGRGTLYIDGVDQLPDVGQERLEELLDPIRNTALIAGNELRLFAAAERDLGELVDAGRFVKELYYRITTLEARLTPLRERPSDIPALAEAIAQELCGALGLPPVTFTPQAFERLSNHLWFGNVTELESVLARTLAIRRPSRIDADLLMFEGVKIVPAASRVERVVRAEAPHVTPGPGLELVANELAHDFRNEMVTVKTFARLAEQSLSGKAEYEGIARLAGEAIDRMDRIIENLLRFSRFRAPNPASLPLARLVAGPVEELVRTLAASGGQIDLADPPKTTVLADPDQIECALSNLFHSLARGSAPGARYTLRYQEPATMMLRLPTARQRRDGRLAAWVDEGDAEQARAVPLGVLIAQNLLAANGGELVFAPAAEPPTVTLRFLPANTERKENSVHGTTAGPDRG